MKLSCSLYGTVSSTFWKQMSLLKLITVEFSMETLQLNCVLSWTLLEFHHVRILLQALKMKDLRIAIKFMEP
jgi:hypothetical protein